MSSDSVIKWVWQHDEYPEFKYNVDELREDIALVEYYRGLIDGVSIFFSSRDLKEIEIDTLTNEALNTSNIEGEYLLRDSVRSSAKKRLDKNFDYKNDLSTKKSDGLIDILIDCNINREPLTKERLHGWHNALFSSGYDGITKVNVAKFRKSDDMEVVSGAIGYEKVHYKAPPAKLIESDIDKLLNWCNNTKENIYLKSAIAHLWFVIIHPYDDGNGRIARAITDYILSSNSKEDFKLYSISTAINSDRKGYYAILDRTTNLFYNRDYDFTPWIKWHLKILINALKQTLKDLEQTIQKTKFWDKCKDKELNSRQIKVLTKILDIGVDNFEGGLTTKKYIAMTKITRITAIRDINELLKWGCISKIEGSAGRNIRYKINLPK